MSDEQIPRHLSHLSDAELVRAARSGQLHAFGELVVRTESLARAVAYSATGDAASVEDMVQEALVTAWTRLGDLADPSAFRPWLAGIVRNTVRYWRRHHKRHAPMAQAGMEALSQLPSDAPSPFDEAQRHQDWQYTQEALHRLPESYREALLLFYSLGESHENVAEALGIGAANARQRVHRARKKLTSDVGTVASAGRRLGARTSAAAGVLVMIQKREAWAAAPVSTPFLGSPKLFFGLGALGGSAIIAGIAALVLLMGAERESIGAPSLHPEHMTTRQGAPFTVFGRPDTSDYDNANYDNAPSDLNLAGTVSMGHGKVGDKSSPEPGPMASAGLGILPKQGEVNSSKASAQRKSGRIRRHGPAVVVDEPPKPLRMPDIDMRAVERERWQ